MSSDRYDLVVLGAGAAGLSAARAARASGRQVLLLDPNPPGGDCTYFGCVPSKTLLETARRVQAARQGPDYGFSAPPTVDFPAVLARVHRVITEISADESAAQLRAEGIDVRQEAGTFAAPNLIRTTSGGQVAAARVVIATGAKATVPAIPGLDQVAFLTNEHIFSLPELPAHLLILGGGPQACELAQAFRRLGSAVTIVESAKRLMGNDEPEAAAVLRTVLEREGVTIHTGATVTAVETGPSLRLADGAVVRGSHLLICIGRTPVTASLGLAAAGIECEPDSGRIRVDGRLRTNRAGVYAAGDCASPLQFTHTGDEQGRIAVQNAVSRRSRRFHSDLVPWATFTDPEIGHVGLTEAQAFARYGARAAVAVVPFATQDRARCTGETDGFVKLIAAPTTALSRTSRYLLRIVGMTAVCPVGAELVHEVVPMMRAGVLAARLGQTIHAYPSWSLTTRIAAGQLFGEVSGARARPAQQDGGASAWPL